MVMSQSGRQRRTSRFIARAVLIAFAALLGFAGTQWLATDLSVLYPRSFSPDGSKFLLLESLDNSNSLRSVTIRHAGTGDVIRDLSKFQWIHGWNIAWSPDGTHVAGVARTADRRDYRIINVQVEPEVRLVAEYPFDHEGRLQHLALSEDNEVLLLHYSVDGSCRLEFRRKKNVAARFEFGSDESPQFIQTRNGLVQLRLFPRPTGFSPAGDPLGDFQVTDGTTPVLLTLDAKTGELVDRLAGPYRGIEGDLNYVVRQNKVSSTICKAEQLEQGIIDLPKDQLPYFIAGRQLVVVSFPPKSVDVVDLDSGQRRKLVATTKSNMMNGPAEKPVIVQPNRHLHRLDIRSGQMTPLVDLSCWPGWKWTALIGLPLLCIAWLGVGLMMGSSNPFADVITLCMLPIFVLMSWSLFGVREFRPELPMMAGGIVCLATAGMLVLIYGSTSNTFWGTLLPTSVGSMAFVVGLSRIWSYDNSFRIVEMLIGGSVALASQIVGLWIVRRFAGRIARVDQTAGGRTNESSTISSDSMNKPEMNQPAGYGYASSLRSEKQMTLRQGFVLTVAFCILFALVRDVRPQEFFFPGAWVFVVWLVLFTSQLAVAGCTATYAALRWQGTSRQRACRTDCIG